RMAKSYGLHNRWCPGFQPMRRIVVGHLVLGDIEDHLSATLKGTCLLQTIHLSVKNANPGWSIELVTGHDVPVAVNITNVDRHVDRTLAAVNQDRDTALVGNTAHFLYRNNGTDRIRH